MIELLAGKLWFPWLLGLSVLTGAVYSLGSGFFPIFECRLWIKTTLASLFQREHTQKGLSSFQALSTALASTIGTGSIAGVASALTLGGPGSIFWMWVTALLGMMTSCAEKILAVRWQRAASDGTLQGGPMYYLRDGAGLRLLFLRAGAGAAEEIRRCDGGGGHSLSHPAGRLAGGGTAEVPADGGRL